VRFSRGRWTRRGLFGALAAALLVTPLATGAEAARAPVPLPAVALPATLDWQAEYQGQKLCSDWAKPGAVQLSKLLADTYGKYTTYITRSCATAGVSEHEEGRAIDWMVDEEIPEERAKAEEFLEWVTAPGPNGELGAMARRMGIMYLIWDDKMWRVYRPEDGWQEYSGCSGKQSEGYDTSCHRDHIHMSLTWDGAYARTSFWTGEAETRGPCTPGSEKRKAGSAATPSTLLNTDSGEGVSGDACRLGAGDSYRSRSYQVQVPVPDTDDPVQVIRLDRFDLNAPESLRISSAETITVDQGTKPGQPIAVPLDSSGTITFTVGAGYGQVWARGLGNDPSAATASDAPAPAPRSDTTAVRADQPAKVARPAVLKLFQPTTLVTYVNTPFTFSGGVRRAGKGAQVVLQRRQGDAPFATVATIDRSRRKYQVVAPPVAEPGTYEYRTVTADRKSVATPSLATRAVVVKPAIVTLAKLAKTPARTRIDMMGAVAGAPAGAVLKVRHKAPGKGWSLRKEKTIGNGPYRAGITVATPGRSRIEVRLVGAGKRWDETISRKVRVVRAR